MSFKDCISSNQVILMEGALGERLKREFKLKTDDTVAMANLVYKENGRTALETLWGEYMDIARKHNLPFIATTPTRRANKERVTLAGYDEWIIEKNVELLRQIKESTNCEMYVGGLMGCKGDAYTGNDSLNTEQAKTFHSWQADLFKEAKVDFLYAGIMPVLSEALGMAMAMADTGIPYIISFTIRSNGRLIDRNTINEAIRIIDSNVSNKPICYMTNCVHPNIVYEALSHEFNQTETVRTRFTGIQANTSALSYEELDASKDLKSSSPASWAEAMIRLKQTYNFKIFGGCCGTDNRHMEELASKLTKSNNI